MAKARRVDDGHGSEHHERCERPASSAGTSRLSIGARRCLMCFVQARCNLEAMMERQLELRREETAAIHQSDVSASLIYFR